MKNFKIGDKVKLKNDLVIGERYGLITLQSFMAFNGIGTVIECEPDGFYEVRLNKHDLCPYIYSEEMLELSDFQEEGFCPNRILKSGNRTIVFWSDGTKTIVKRAEDEPDNDYAAFTAALGIKIFGSNSALRRMIKKTVKVQEKKEKNR